MAVCRFEADPSHVLGQTVWVLSHNLNGFIAVGLEDADRPCRADTMGMEEDHDLPHRLLLGPAGDDAGGSHRADAGNFRQALRSRLDDLKSVHPKGCHDALGHGRADAAHLTGGEVLLNALSPSRWRGLENLGLELQSMGSVAYPNAARRDPFTSRHGRAVADHGHKIPLASRMNLQDGKAILGIVEGNAFDGAREGL